jgi:hypothetical protein
MWKANGKTTALKLFLDSLSPKTEKLSLEEAMDLLRDRLIPELEFCTYIHFMMSVPKVYRGSGVDLFSSSRNQTIFCMGSQASVFIVDGK